MAWDSAVRAGTSFIVRQALMIGRPFTNRQRHASRLPNSSAASMARFALFHGRFNLLPVPDNAGVGEQARDARGREPGDAPRIEAVEHLAVAVALAEDGDPAEASLGALEHEHLEQPSGSSCRGVPHSRSWYSMYSGSVPGQGHRAGAVIARGIRAAVAAADAGGG